MSFLLSIQKIFSPRKRIIGATDLKRALAHNEFVFYYQPEWDLKTGEVKGLEALMRWESPNGIVPPNDFIPVLEESGLISEFTPFLFDQTLKDLKELHSLGFTDLFMSVNLSPVQLRDTNLTEVISEMMTKHGVIADSLECEVTESMEMDPNGIEMETLKKIREMGIKLSIDDFGSGHASFNYLKDLEARKLKVDRDFIMTLFDRPANQTIMRTIIGLGHSLGLLVLAEGIETPDQERWLKNNSCDYGQGFFFARPLPLPMLISFLRNKDNTTARKK